MNYSKRKLVAIVFTDIVGFTKLSSKNEPAALALLEKQRELLKPIVEKNNGEWLKEIGDGLLLIFGTNRDAIECAIEIQYVTKNVVDLDLRIGIHQGEVFFQGKDVIGDDVNIASRIEPFAATGGIALSGRVNSSLERDPEFETMFVGSPQLKGVSQKVEIYCIVSHNLPKTDTSKVQAKMRKKGFQLNFISISGVTATLIGLLFWINFSFLGIGFTDINEVLSVAILPFENKGEKRDDFYAYGISSDLIKDVSSTGMLRVAAMANIEKLDYSEMNNNELADILQVRYVAKGTLWKMDSIFQLSMELFDTKKSKVVWSNRWQTNWSNLPTIKGDLSNEILVNLNIIITKNVEQVNVAGNPEAYEYYLKGKFKAEKRTSLEDIEISRGMFEKAINLDSTIVRAVSSLAKTYYLTGNLDKAEGIFNKAIKISLRVNDRVVQADALSGLGVVQYLKGNLDEALKLYYQARNIAEELGDKDEIARNLNNIAIIYSARGDFERTIEMLLETRNIKESLDDKYGIAIANQNLSVMYNKIGKHELSFEHILKAYELSKQIKNLNIQANALVNISIHHMQDKDFEDALRQLNEAVDIYDNLGDKAKLIQTLHQITHTYSEMHKDAEALKTSERALSLSKELKNDPLICMSHIYMSHAHNELENKSEALGNLYHAKKINEHGNNQDMLGIVLGQLGKHFKETGNLDSSMYYGKESLKIYEKLGNKRGIRDVLALIAGIFLQEGSTELSIDNIDKAMIIAKELKDDAEYYFYHFWKGLVYFQEKNYAKAMDEHLSKFYEWNNKNKKDISLNEMSIYLVCLKKLNKNYELFRLEKLMEEIPERKYEYETNYRLYQLYDKNSYLKNAYDRIMDLKSKLDKETGENFISFPLESEIIEVYENII